MKRIILAVTAALALSGCALAGLPTNLLPTAPAAVADRTILDEKAAVAVELTYKAWRTAAEAATDAGWVKGAQAVKVADLDRRAYDAVKAVRAAYNAGNAANYKAAFVNAQKVLASASAALGK